MGRFISRDPLGYVDGTNLYAGYFSMNLLGDPFGLTNKCTASASGKAVSLSWKTYSDWYFQEYGDFGTDPN